MIDYCAMANPAHQPVFTSSDYLVWEEEQVERHEFLDGEVFAMAGAEDKHVTVSMNLMVALHQHLRSSPCRIYASDMRLHVEKADAYFYPDVFVTCSKKDLESAKVKTEPILIAEVLSPSTKRTDLGEKFENYTQIPTLREYVIVSQDTPHLQIFRRRCNWKVEYYYAGDTFTLESVGLEMTVDTIYRRVRKEVGLD